MNLLSPHKFWCATLVTALVVIFCNASILDFLRGRAVQHLSAIQDERAKIQSALQRLDDDIATTKRLSGQIGADEIEKSLAPVDRLQAADLLEKQASASRLEHFTYTLYPEQKITLSNPGMGTEELALSTVTVKADAPLDRDVYSFVERIHSLMPGRLKLQSLTLDRISDEKAFPAGINLHMMASFEWLSNGTASQVTETK